MAHFYEVIVSNVGKVYEGKAETAREARLIYLTYVDRSKSGRGRCAGESVSLWRDNEPIDEYDGDDFELPVS